MSYIGPVPAQITGEGAFTTLTSSNTTTLNGTVVPASSTLVTPANKDASGGITW